MSRRVARPYAAALFQVVERQGLEVLRTVEAELGAVAEVFRREPEVLRVFEVPTVLPAKKRELLDELGGALDMRTETRRLLAALLQHYRLRDLPDVVTTFRDLVDRKEGLVRGRVTLPAAPREGQMTALRGALQASMEARVELESALDPDMLAGFVVRLGSKVFDGSLRTQLHRFAQSAQE